jgi:hypothetical protein
LRKWELTWIGTPEEEAVKTLCPGPLWRPE